MPPPEIPAARRIARRLVDAGKSGESASRTSAAVIACNQLYRNVSRWVGSDGCHALFTRAFSQVRTSYPVLEKIQLRAGSDPYIEESTEAIEAVAAPATAEALETIIAAVIELLGRLIGDDMAIKLVAGKFLESPHSDANPQNRRAQS